MWKDTQAILLQMWKIEEQIKALEWVKNNKGKKQWFEERIQEQIDELQAQMDRLKKQL